METVDQVANDGINVARSGHPTGHSIIGLHVEDNETYCNGWTPNPSGGTGARLLPDWQSLYRATARSA